MNRRFVRYNRDVKNLIILAAVLLTAVSCTSLSDTQVAAAASEVSANLNSGDVDALTGSSGTSFLFETEILPSPVQLRTLWEGLAASGYDFGPDGEIEVFNPDENTWERFSSSREIEVWFRNHAPEEAVIAVIPTSDGRLVLVIDRNKKSHARIRGLKVEPE